ncbi:MAG: DNA polymerase III subunit beta [Cyanobacteriota bacterium]
MEFSISVTECRSRLAIADRAIPSKPSHPVLANVLIEADSETQKVSFTGFDLSIGIKTEAIAQVVESGSITLPSKLLGDIVAHLPEGDLLIKLKDLTVQIKGVGNYEIRGLAPGDYPELPNATEQEATLPREMLLQGIGSSAPFTSTDETKQVLTGVRFQYRAGELEFAATDGHRLSVRTIALAEPEVEDPAEESPEIAVTIPAKALRDLGQAVGDDEAIAVSLDRHQIVFRWRDGMLTSRLLEGEYPNYRQLIPNRFAVVATGDRCQLMAALERIAVLADKKNNIIKLAFSEEKVEITVDAPDVGSGYESMPFRVTGNLVIALNVRYLLEGLKAMNSQEVQIQMNSPTSPVVIGPIGAGKHQYLVMPIQIRSN